MLAELRLENFKSFVDETIPLGRVVFLAGMNASGKSNLLDALQFLQGVGLDLPLDGILGGVIEGEREVWPGIRGGIAEAAGRAGARFAITTKWSGQQPELEYGVVCDIEQTPLFLEERLAEQARSGPPYIAFSTHDQGLAQVAVKSTDTGFRICKRDARRSVLAQLTTLQQGLDPFAIGFSSIAGERLRALISFDFSPARMRAYVPSQREHLGSSGENLSAVLNRLAFAGDEARQSIVGWLADMAAPQVVDLEFSRTDLGDVLLRLVEADGTKVSARSLSDGTLRFLAFLAMLRTVPEGSTILLEEPDVGLHPNRIHLLTTNMLAAADERNLQIIATTHSAQLLDSLPADRRDAVYVVGRPEGAAGSIVRRAVDLPGIEDVLARRGFEYLLSSAWMERAL